ncbi:MAG: hypothetical protein BWY06_03482 [Candidatus Latescibacteria bacterium ADurb.Bin168]|nr:MAG: hypothetical protein BWY06_03482 [Candidatus Latescibacteria bacterium ADurb.Bin168]
MSLASFCKMILSTATVWLQSGVANRRLGARVNLPRACLTISPNPLIRPYKNAVITPLIIAFWNSGSIS